MYADNIVLMAESPLRAAENDRFSGGYAEKWFTFNAEKSKVMVVRTSSEGSRWKIN